MTALRQDFLGVVEGGVAGRDVNHHHNNRTTVLQFTQQKPESQLQSEFARRTGIWCPKPAREWLESLMADHQFTARELAVSWKAGSIGWHAETNEKRIVTPWIEAAFVYLMGLMALPVIAIFVFWTFAPTVIKPGNALALFALACSWVLIGLMVNRFMWQPRRVAQRIRRVQP